MTLDRSKASALIWLTAARSTESAAASGSTQARAATRVRMRPLSQAGDAGKPGSRLYRRARSQRGSLAIVLETIHFHIEYEIERSLLVVDRDPLKSDTVPGTDAPAEGTP